MRHTHLPRQGPVAAASHCDLRNGMVGTAEGTLRNKRRACRQFACYRVDLCGLEAFGQ